MSVRTVADPLAKDAVTHLRSTLAGGFLETIQQVVRDGETLSRPDLWDGPRAIQFRQSWPELRGALQNAHSDLTELAGSIDAITTAIMHAGGA
ncbi:MAG: pyrophosphorylase [Acidimicrobiales bacterium]